MNSEGPIVPGGRFDIEQSCRRALKELGTKDVSVKLTAGKHNRSLFERIKLPQ